MNWEIKGGTMPVVEIQLAKGEAVNCEAGAMVWMNGNMKMETHAGGIGKVFGRMFSGEGMFTNTYVAERGNGMVTFGTCFPGNIVAVEVQPGRELICQKSAYLASTPGVEMSIAFQKKISGGFFGGEGFIMQRISGNGIVFLEIDGSAVTYNLAPGEKLVIDTGHLAVMDGTCNMSVEKAGAGVKNLVFGGEGFFNTVVTGPGNVTVQTMPKNALAAAISSLMPKN